MEKNITNLLRQVNTPQLTLSQKEHCELQVEINECSKALKELKNGKSPGMMSISQRLGLITILPKKDKDRLLLKNWRPVSLLTTDYNIITKMLALRLANILPTIIDHDQTAYIKGRYIGENIRTIADVIEYYKQKNMTGVLLLIDFEKAFDTIKWKFLHKVLKKFNFGPTFQRWIYII